MVSYKISESAVEFVKNNEGFSSTPYSDGGGMTIGYGHQILPTEKLTAVDEKGATLLLRSDLQKRMNAFNSVLTSSSLSENQITALLDWSMSMSPENVKRSSLIPLVNTYAYKRTDESFEALKSFWLSHYITSSGLPHSGLKARREREFELFQKPSQNQFLAGAFTLGFGNWFLVVIAVLIILGLFFKVSIPDIIKKIKSIF